MAERNAFGAVKAVKSARMAMAGEGNHKVSLDQVIRTMLQTGHDMKRQYKETSLGGLALNVIQPTGRFHSHLRHAVKVVQFAFGIFAGEMV